MGLMLRAIISSHLCVLFQSLGNSLGISHLPNVPPVPLLAYMLLCFTAELLVFGR